MNAFLRRFAGGFLALTALVSTAASASHVSPLVTSTTSNSSGVTATYTFQLTPSNNGINPAPNPIPSPQGIIQISFPVGFDLSGAAFNVMASGVGTCGFCTPTSYSAFPGHSVSLNAGTRTLRITSIATNITDNQTGFKVVLTGVKNPSVNGTYAIPVRILYDAGGGDQPYAFSNASVTIVTPPGVNLSASTPAPLTYANELIAPFNVTTVNGSPQDLADNIAFDLGYNFSGGEVRYGRLACTSLTAPTTTNMTLTNPVINESSPDITLGAINGSGTNALFFSITATNPVSGPTAGIALDVDADLAFQDKNGTNCEFSIYDQPSEAQAGGATGRIFTTGSKPFARFADAVAFSTTGGLSTADVQAIPAYTQFVGGDNLFGQLTFGLVSATRLDKDGLQITMADIFAATTKVTLAGSFDAATSVTWNGVVAAPLTTSLATWSGNTAISGEFAYNNNGTTEIQASSYTASLVPVANTGYSVAAASLSNAGTIERNGTQLQAPLAQLPTGYLSRIAITNTGSVARTYSIKVISETGNTITTNSANMTGTVPANGMKFFELNTVISSFTTATRAAVIVTVDAPDKQIQAVYQIIKPETGAISNHVMVRPGTN